MNDPHDQLNDLISPKVDGRVRNGGARTGAGRKRKHDKNATAIEQAESRIRDRLPQLIDNLFELGNGVVVQEAGKNGKPRVYQRAPDFKALAYLVDRIMGKPTERRELVLEKPLADMTDDELEALANEV